MGINIGGPPPAARDRDGNPWITGEQWGEASRLLMELQGGREEARAELIALHLAWGYDPDWIERSLAEVEASWRASGSG